MKTEDFRRNKLKMSKNTRALLKFRKASKCVKSNKDLMRLDQQVGWQAKELIDFVYLKISSIAFRGEESKRFRIKHLSALLLDSVYEFNLHSTSAYMASSIERKFDSRKKWVS